MGYSPWGHEELDTTERLTTTKKGIYYFTLQMRKMRAEVLCLPSWQATENHTQVCANQTRPCRATCVCKC